jgi:DNA polymerase III sliding clamp (beta) subunit (PCNA family)
LILAQGIADRKSTMPMLANLLLRTQGKNQPFWISPKKIKKFLITLLRGPGLWAVA